MGPDLLTSEDLIRRGYGAARPAAVASAAGAAVDRLQQPGPLGPDRSSVDFRSFGRPHDWSRMARGRCGRRVAQRIAFVVRDDQRGKFRYAYLRALCFLREGSLTLKECV